MIGGACQGATPTSLPQPIGAALRPPWPSATIEGLAPYAGLYSLLTVSANAATHVTTTTSTSSSSSSSSPSSAAAAVAALRSSAPPPMSPQGATITTPMAGVVATHAVLAQLHALCVQQKDGALAGALPPILPPGQMTMTPTMLESGPRISLALNNNNNINNNNNNHHHHGGGTPKSTYGAITTVAASRCVTVGSRDDLRISSASNVSKVPLMTSQTAPKYGHKKTVPVLPAPKMNGRAVSSEPTNLVMKKNNFISAKEQKDKVASVVNTHRTLEQPLNCKVSARTIGAHQVSSPVSGHCKIDSSAALALSNSATSLASMYHRDVENSQANHVPVNEKDTVKFFQTHKPFTPQVTGKPFLVKTSVPNVYETYEYKARNSENFNFNGTSVAEMHTAVSLSSNSHGFRSSDSVSSVKPKVNHGNTYVSLAHQPPCDAIARCESKEATAIRTIAVQPVCLTTNLKEHLRKEEKIKSCSGVANEICPDEYNDEAESLKKHNSTEEVGGGQLAYVIGDQCSRTTPGLHETYVQGRKVKARPQHAPTAAGTVASPPMMSPTNTPISVGDTSSSCPPIVALTQLAVPRVAPPANAAASAGGTNGDTCNRLARKTSCRTEEKPTTTVAGGGSIPVGIAVARQRQEPRPPDDSSGALPNGAATSPAGNPLPAHWPLPPTPCTPGIPSAPFWLPQSQFSGVGVDASVGAGMGLGYQFVRDPLGGHLYVLPHPHTIPDPGGHSLVWAGYGGVTAAPPVVMTPQQLLLPDAHYHPALHSHPLVHVPHAHAPVHSPTPNSIKREDPPTPGTPDEDPKSRSLNLSLTNQGPTPGADLNLPSLPAPSLRHLPPPFLYPPASTLPYYLPQSPHGAPYSITPYPHPPTSTMGSSGLTSSLQNSLTTTLTDTITPQGNITTTFSVLPAAPVTSVTRGSGLEHCSPKECESLVATGSPVQSDSSEPINVTSHSEEEADIELPISRVQPLKVPSSLHIPFKIKQEIKEEIPSPVGLGKEDAPTLGAVELSENHVSESRIIAIKKEAYIGCEESELHEDTSSHSPRVFLSHVSQPCSQTIASTYPTMLTHRYPNTNLPIIPNSIPSAISTNVSCQESSEFPEFQPHAIDYSKPHKETHREPPLSVPPEADSCPEPQRAHSPDPCDRISSETHSSTNLESSHIPTSSKALIVNPFSHSNVFPDSRPLTVVHPVPQASHGEESDSASAGHCTVPHQEEEEEEEEEEKREDEEEEEDEEEIEEEEVASEAAPPITDEDSERVQQQSYLDLSGLELLSQSVLQHANRLSSMSPEQRLSECAPSACEETPVEDTESQIEESTEVQSSASPCDHISSTEVEHCGEDLSLDSCRAEESNTEGYSSQEQDEKDSDSQEQDEKDSDSHEQDEKDSDSQDMDEKELTENSEQSSETEVSDMEEASENVCSTVVNERLEVRDRLPELVQACLSELPCSPTSPSSPVHSSSEPVVSVSSAEISESPGESMPDRISGLHGLSLLCALAEQRIMEEEHVACPALSSLADIAATSPSVPTHPPIIERSPSPQPGPSHVHRTVFAGPFGIGSSNAVFGTTTFGTIANSYSTPIKSTEVNRNYKSPESEREAKAYIANKASQYQKEALENFKTTSGFPVDSMDATELDMRMQLAELQRKYKEKQLELSRLPSKKIAASPVKRGPGRPPKRKIINNDVPGKKKVGRPPSKRKMQQKELSPPVLERVTDFEIKDLSKDSDDDKEENRNNNRSILKPPVLTATFTNHRVINGNRFLASKTLETQVSTEKEESSDEDTRRWSISSEDTAPPSLGSPFKLPVSTPETKLEESEEEQIKDIPTDSSAQDLKVLNIETSVESSPSDLEQQSTSSASKKRKPGRPKKHSPTKEDATETIVAKKPKTLNFLLHRPLLSHKPKMKPKLKAEVKVREEEEEDNSLRSHYTLSSNIDQSAPAMSDDDDDLKSNVRLGSVDLGRCVRKRGCPSRRRTPLTRRVVLRDKEKRKSAAEKQSTMEALYRSLKYSTVAAAEHDESEEERDKEEKEIIDDDIVKDIVGTMSFCDSSSSDHETSQRLSEGDIISSSSAPVYLDTPTVITTMTTVAAPPTTTTAVMVTAASEAPRPTMQTPEPSVCLIDVGDLVDKARVLVLQDALLYAGHVVPITPPDVYGVVIDGERGSRPHIYCREDLLQQAWKEVKPGTSRFLVEGTRVCAFWSQQYRALYPGCVAASTSPAHEANHNFVNVEFDDGDSGKIHVDDIRLLPVDFPVIEYDPNPLMTLNKRKRRPTGDSHSSDIRENLYHKMKPKKVRTYSGTSVDSDCRINDQDDESLEVEKENKSSTVNIENKVKESPVKLQNKKNDKKKHKKHKHTDSSHHHRHKHRNKHKHKHREGDRPLPHVEPGVNELTMRIKSPPPPLSESQRQKQTLFIRESDSEEEDSSKSPSEEESEGNDSEYTPTKKDMAKSSARKKKRHPSGKSKIAPFLPERQLWRWSGKGFKRPGSKGKGKKEFFKAIVRGKEMIRVDDCAVFLSAGQPDRPYIGRIEHMWESWGGNMVVKVKWFYHPQETKGLGRRLTEPKGALFQSPHTDENDVQTISHKCDVIALSDYKIRRGELETKYGPNYENCDVYYLAGSYDPISGHITMEPGVS